MYYMIYIITWMPASLFSPAKDQVRFLTVNDCDISKCLVKWSTLPVFERGDGTPGGPELGKGTIDGEKANLSKMK